MRPFFGYMVCAALAATVVSCRHEMPLQYMAGVVEAASPASLTVRSIAGDSVLMFVVDEATERSGGDAIEGNAVEVCYRGSHDSPELTALSVTGNETYTDVLGRWATGRRAELPVEIELLPRGEVRQTAPPIRSRKESQFSARRMRITDPDAPSTTSISPRSSSRSSARAVKG